MPQVPGYEFELIDEHTLEVEVSKEQSLNEVFASLTAQGIGVLSMRNKVNRLEELFMKLVERKPGAAARVAMSDDRRADRRRRRIRPRRWAPRSGSVSRPSSSASTAASSASGRRPSCPRRSRRRCTSSSSVV